VLTFTGLLDDLAAGPDRIGVIDDAGAHTWREIRDDAARVARALSASGIRPGDPVACLMRNRATWISCAVAATGIGALFVPLNTWSTARELRWALRHTNAVALLAEEEFLGHRWADELAAIEPALARAEPGNLDGEELPDLRTVAWTSGSHRGGYDWRSFLRPGEGVDLEARRYAVEPDAPAFVLYTSGSTGTPKGVVLSQHRMLANAVGNAERRGIGPADRIWLGSPLFYGLGATNVLPMALVTGAALVLADRFDPERALASIERHGCTTFVGTSNMIRRIVESPGFSPDRVTTLTKGNASIGVAERRLLVEKMGVTGACTGYGVTECSGMVFVGDPGDDLDLTLTTAGRLLPGWEARVVDRDTGAVLPTGRVGLLEVRGYTALGYLHAPEATAAAFTADGWYRTGDLVALGADGRLRWRDRLKEIIKTGGIMVSPAEIEHLLAEHLAVAEAYVFGIPDRVQLEVPVAVVVATDGAEPTEQELREHVGRLAARFKVPAAVEVRKAADVPRTVSGKVDKPALRAQWAAR
jgi:fatty-acyl-CoA synthase